MESGLYAVNLAVHIVAAVGCAAAPFYQLRMVAERGRYGPKLFYQYDASIERILSFQPKLCLALIIVLIATGFAFPLIFYGFHGYWRPSSPVALWTYGAKTVLALAGLGVVLYGILSVDPKIQALFRGFSPDAEPDPEELKRFFSLRAHRKQVCSLCLWLALAILLITPLLRFF